MPALHDSAEHGDLVEVRRLLEEGTSVNQLDDSDETALHGANPNAADDYGETVLARAASAGHLDVVRLLLRAGARSSTPGELGKRSHELARENGHPEVAAELLGALGAENAPS